VVNRAYDGASKVEYGSPTIGGEPLVATMVLTGSEMISYLNGDSDGWTPTYATAYSQAIATDDPINIGTQSGFDLNGTLYEVMIFDRALTDGERIQVETYLGTKYGIGVIPEPASALLLLMALLALVARRRR
jgi:hypothetical protein